MQSVAMFSKLKPAAGGQPGTTSNMVEANPITQYYEVGRFTGSAGPELVWKIYDAVRKCDKREASVFFFEKKIAEKIHKPRRKETVTEILRHSIMQLDRFKHAKLLTLYHPIEESCETLAFATEPVLGSLANVLGCLSERLPQSIPANVRDYKFLDTEIKYGLLQVTEGLSFLHYSAKLIHRNICPQSIIINKKGTWKLAGLEFTVKTNDLDTMGFVACQAFSSKNPKMSQPDLDYIAPEIQQHCKCSPLSDMFSLGLLISSIFIDGHSILESNLSTTIYTKNLEQFKKLVHDMLEHVPHHLQEPLQCLLSIDTKRRPSAQHFSMIKYFYDPAVHALQYLDTIQMKDSAHKTQFYHSLKDTLPAVPRKLWYQHVFPCLKQELQSPEVLAAALQPLLYMVDASTSEEYQEMILPSFRSVFGMPKSVQATVALLENLDIVMKKTPKNDIKSDVLPMLYNAFDSSTPQVQCAALHAVSSISEHLEENAVRKMVLPRTKHVFENNSGIKVQATALACLEKIIDKLEKKDILDEVLPMLARAKLQDPAILMPVVSIYKHMLSDKRYGLTANLVATKVMPSLVPLAVCPALKYDEFACLMELLQEMLEMVARSQRNKLKLEKMSISSQDRLPLQLQLKDPMSQFPGHPPPLRLSGRRTSISVDDFINRPGSSSPDSNLLRVQANLPNRRHSDNSVMPPRIQVAPCSPDTHHGVSMGQIRRHSSTTPQQFQNQAGLDFLSSQRSARRYSACPSPTSMLATNHTGSQSSLLQQLGSGVQSLLFSGKS
ncbi:Uncharacterised protein g6973 [Pycnogonum litorale]